MYIVESSISIEISLSGVGNIWIFTWIVFDQENPSFKILSHVRRFFYIFNYTSVWLLMKYAGGYFGTGFLVLTGYFLFVGYGFEIGFT